MKHTPYGYDIVGGKAVVNEEQADIIRKICSNYLSGMSMTAAAKDAGVTMTHSRVKHLLQNKRYLGDDFYPPILTEELAQYFETERLKRDAAYKGIRYRRNMDIQIPVAFKIPRVISKYKDPVKQAEYAYALIESEV